MTITSRTETAAMPGSWPRSKVARCAGGLYLAYILANVLASMVGRIGLSDAATLREAIADNEPMFRIGLVAAFASALLFVATAWALYTLLRSVDEATALLLLVLNAVGVAIQCASYLFLLAVLSQQDSSLDLQGLTGGQLNGLAMVSVSTYHAGFVTAQLFFSAWLFPLAWLVLRCEFLPRILGWILLLDGVAVFVWFLQALLAPTYTAISYPAWVIGFVAEVGLALWLLIKGTNETVPPPLPTG